MGERQREAGDDVMARRAGDKAAVGRGRLIGARDARRWDGDGRAVDCRGGRLGRVIIGRRAGGIRRTLARADEISERTTEISPRPDDQAANDEAGGGDRVRG